MDNDFWVDAQEIHKIIDDAPVVIVRFSTVSQRMLIDSRCGPEDPPVISLVGRVRGPEQRFRELRQARPRMTVPDEIMSFQWPRPVMSFVRGGTMEHIIERFAELGFPDAETQVRRTFHELMLRERRELFQALRGEGYQTLWERKPS